MSQLESSPSASNITSASVQTLTDSHLLVIMASLLCALICLTGLLALIRCAWIRQVSLRSIASPHLISLQTPSSCKGINKKILNSLPRETFTSSMSPKLTECAICLSDFSSGEEIRVLPHCGHGFHVACIDLWLSSRSSCPSCRRVLVVARCRNCGGMPPQPSSFNFSCIFLP